MKKFLVILTLVLALCLVCGIAMAEEDLQVGSDGVIHHYDLSAQPIKFELPHWDAAQGKVVNGYIRFACVDHNQNNDNDDFKDYPILPSARVFYTYNEVIDNLDDSKKVKAYQLPTCDPAKNGWIEVYVNEAASQKTTPERLNGVLRWEGWEGPSPETSKIDHKSNILLKGGHLASNVAKNYTAYGYKEPQYTDSKVSTCSVQGELNVYCLRCKEKLSTIILEVNPSNHTSPVTIDVKPTCSSGGHFRYYCEACGKDIDPENKPELTEEDLPPLAPDDPNTIHSDEGFMNKVLAKDDPRNQDNKCDKNDDETKTQPQVRVYYQLCADCNYRLITVETTPWHHTWGEWTYVTEPTCIADGELERTCADCGKVENYPGYVPQDEEEKELLDKMIKASNDKHPVYEVICEGWVNTDDLDDPWDDAQVNAVKQSGKLTKSTSIWDNGKSCQLRVLNEKYELVTENQDYYFIYRCSKCNQIARVAIQTADDHTESKVNRLGTCEDKIIQNNPDKAFDWVDVQCSVCKQKLADSIKGAKHAHSPVEGAWVKTVDGGEDGASNWMNYCTVCGDVVNLVTYDNPNDPKPVEPEPQEPEEPEPVPTNKTFTQPKQGEEGAPSLNENTGEFSGKITLTEGAEAPAKMFARISFFIEGGECFVIYTQVDENDGEYEYTANIMPSYVERIVRISVQILNKGVSPAREGVTNLAPAAGYNP